MPIAPDGPAPYAPAGKVIDVVEHHRKTGLPLPITTEVIERVTGTPGLAPRVMKTLRLFDLVDDGGLPTPQFEEMAKAQTDSDFKERFAGVVRAAYADVFQYIDPATSPAEHIEGQFRAYTPRGQRERMVALFRGLCQFTGIVPERQQANSESKPRTPRRSTPKPKREKKPGETGLPRSPVPEDFQPSPPPASGQHPLIQGLLMALPPAGQVWPRRARENWTKAALANFDLLYELPPDDREGGE